MAGLTTKLKRESGDAPRVVPPVVMAVACVLFVFLSIAALALPPAAGNVALRATPAPVYASSAFELSLLVDAGVFDDTQIVNVVDLYSAWYVNADTDDPYSELSYYESDDHQNAGGDTDRSSISLDYMRREPLRFAIGMNLRRVFAVQCHTLIMSQYVSTIPPPSQPVYPV